MVKAFSPKTSLVGCLGEDSHSFWDRTTVSNYSIDSILCVVRGSVSRNPLGVVGVSIEDIQATGDRRPPQGAGSQSVSTGEDKRSRLTDKNRNVTRVGYTGVGREVFILAGVTESFLGIGSSNRVSGNPLTSPTQTTLVIGDNLVFVPDIQKTGRAGPPEVAGLVARAVCAGARGRFRDSAVIYLGEEKPCVRGPL